MDLTARDIHEKQFHDSWRGYNQEEVDEYLDRIADVLDRLQRENSALHSRVTDLDHAVSTSRDTEEMLKKTLITAQQAAEEAIASAKAKAEALIQEAEERTRSAHVEATEKIQAADAEARRKSLEADREHTIRKREIDASLEKLRRFERDLKRRLTAFLADQTRGLERLTEEEPPVYQPPAAGTQAAVYEPPIAAAEADDVSEDVSDEAPAVIVDAEPVAQDEIVEESTEEDEPRAQFVSDETSQWIPDFVASKENGNGETAAAEASDDDKGSWEEPGFVRNTDIASLYGTAEIEIVQDDVPPTEDASDDEPQASTVTLAEEETTPAPQRSGRHLFWRGDG